jgi:hypothetical protein
MRKRKIAILNIDSILNNFNLSQGAKVLVTTNSKWVYMLNSVEKWLYESQLRKNLWLMAPSSVNQPF